MRFVKSILFALALGALIFAGPWLKSRFGISDIAIVWGMLLVAAWFYETRFEKLEAELDYLRSRLPEEQDYDLEAEIRSEMSSLSKR